jgi:3-oxoacyl-[acyl-carrier protein] reductase
MTDSMPKRVIVTGASNGIGRAIAERLTGEGWQVCNVDRVPPASDNEPNGHWFEAELTDDGSIDDAVGRILRDGPVLGIVNNAGVVRPAPLENTTRSDFDQVTAVNVWSGIRIAQSVLPGMKDAGFGRIVNISSRAQLGKTDRTAYAAAKAAVISMARVWALELGAYGITCNAVAPGAIGTDLWLKANPPDHPRTRGIIDGIPMKRMGAPDDIANAVSFFFDDRSGYVTGQVLYVCGGLDLARGGS